MEINGITTRNGRIKAFHTEDRVRIKFLSGVYTIEPDHWGKGQESASIILTPRELLDLINMLNNQYEQVRSKYEFGYGNESD